ncbi:MAG: type I restriction enzyme HsdR N-terminal domain-containing protein [Chitinophagales bacterium]
MEIQFSDYAFKIKAEDGKQVIFDHLRKKWLVLTPEEWVRQHILHYLTDDHGFPASLISIEKKLRVFGLSRRTDVVLYNRTMQPVLIVECKAGEVRIDEKFLSRSPGIILH